MLKPLLAQVKEFKRASILTPIFVVLEVVMELAIPLMMASIIDNGIDKGDMAHVCKVGGIMACMALLSLFFGVAAGRLAARASSGFARNLRRSMFANIQTFAFSNLDKYSTSGLITRMTTDVTNVQNAYLHAGVRPVHGLFHQCQIVPGVFGGHPLPGLLPGADHQKRPRRLFAGVPPV